MQLCYPYYSKLKVFELYEHSYYIPEYYLTICIVFQISS